MSTFSPYDINKVDAELVTKEKKSEENARFWRLCAAVALGLAGAITLGVLRLFIFNLQGSIPGVPISFLLNPD
jgi:hypothetical protein